MNRGVISAIVGAALLSAIKKKTKTGSNSMSLDDYLNTIIGSNEIQLTYRFTYTPEVGSDKVYHDFPEIIGGIVSSFSDVVLSDNYIEFNDDDELVYISDIWDDAELPNLFYEGIISNHKEDVEWFLERTPHRVTYNYSRVYDQSDMFENVVSYMSEDLHSGEEYINCYEEYISWLDGEESSIEVAKQFLWDNMECVNTELELQWQSLQEDQECIITFHFPINEATSQMAKYEFKNVIGDILYLSTLRAKEEIYSGRNFGGKFEGNFRGSSIIRSIPPLPINIPSLPIRRF